MDIDAQKLVTFYQIRHSWAHTLVKFLQIRHYLAKVYMDPPIMLETNGL